jgi:hypothetical protein
LGCFVDIWFPALAQGCTMPHQRAAYLRDQADKCRWHADHMTDAEIKEQLRKLAVEYIERAALVESAEIEDRE